MRTFCTIQLKILAVAPVRRHHPAPRHDRSTASWRRGGSRASGSQRTREGKTPPSLLRRVVSAFNQKKAIVAALKLKHIRHREVHLSARSQTAPPTTNSRSTSAQQRALTRNAVPRTLAPQEERFNVRKIGFEDERLLAARTAGFTGEDAVAKLPHRPINNGRPVDSRGPRGARRRCHR
jgi:hypothetical protein